MIATLDYIKRKFDEYNALCFEGKLRPIVFKLSTARTYLGQIAFARTRNPKDGTWHYDRFVFRISTKRDLSEKEMEDTILHEMIHYWILSNQMQDTAPHGKLFVRKMNEINVRFNRHISITHKVTPEDHEKDREIRPHLVCVSRLRDGRHGIMIAARSRLYQLWDAMSLFREVSEWKWVITKDPFFNRYRRALTPKIYPIRAEELDKHLKDALQLERTGNQIRVKR